MTIDRSTLTVEIILEKFILARTIVAADSKCWLWQGYITTTGIATVRIPDIHKRVWNTKQVAKFIYQANGGKIRRNLWFSRQCETVGCVNPDHFRVATAKKVLRQAEAWKRLSDRTECRKGHPYSPANTKLDRKGARICVSCKRTADRDRQRQKRIEAIRNSVASEEFGLSQALSGRSKKYYVYHLVDPATKEVFYVGKGSGSRAFQHSRDAIEFARINPEKEARIRVILGEGLKVKIEIVQRGLTEENAFLLERQEIERIGLESRSYAVGVRSISCARRALAVPSTP